MSIERPRLRFIASPRKRRSRIAAVGATLALALLSQAGLDPLHGGKVVWLPGERPLVFWADADPNAKTPAWLDALPIPVLTTIFLTSGTTYNDPGNWNDGNNKIEAIGRGQNGSSGGKQSNGVGGDGGDYAARTNVALSANGDFPITISVTNDASFNLAHSGRDVLAAAGNSSNTSIGSLVHTGGLHNGIHAGGAAGPDANGGNATGSSNGVANGGISFQWDSTHKPGNGNGSDYGGGGPGGASGGGGAGEPGTPGGAALLVITYSALNLGNGTYGGAGSINAPARLVDVQSKGSFSGIASMVLYKRFDGEGAVAGNGSLAASGFLRDTIRGTLSGQATLTSTTRGPWHANATLSGVASLSAKTSLVFATAALAGSGAIALNGFALHPGATAFAGNGSLAAQGLGSNQNFCFPAAIAGLSASSVMRRAITPILAGVASINCDARISTANALLVGDGIVDVAPVAIFAQDQTCAGQGLVACETSVLRATNALLEGVCIHNVDTIRLSSIGSSRHGQAFMRANALRLLALEATLAGSAHISAKALRDAKAAFNATSSLIGKARRLTFDGAALSGVGSATADTLVGHRQQGEADLSAVASLGSSGSKLIRASARLAGDASLASGAAQTLYPRALAHGSAGITAIAVHNPHAETAFSSFARITAKSVYVRLASSDIAASSSLQVHAFPAAFMGASCAGNASLMCDARAGAITYQVKVTANDQATRSRVLLRA